MKRKWILIAVLVIVVLVNPSKFGSFSNSINKKSVELENIKNIDINKNIHYIEYDKNLVYYNDNSLKSISPSGKEIFNTSLDIKNLELESNRFIDILDKDRDIAYSIDKEGKVVSKKNMNKNGLLYKSIENDSYIYVYRKDNQDIVNIYDYEFKLVKSINVKGRVTNVEYSDKGIYVVSINTESKLTSTIDQYDFNGNLKNTKSVDNSVVLDIINYEDNIYMIEKNKISRINSNLKALDEFEVKDISYYSNIYKNSMYVIESDGKVKYIDKGIEDVKISIEKLNGIIKTSDSLIMYTDNKIMNNKGVELKKFDENIKDLLLIQNDTLVVELESSIQIINIK